MQITEALIEKFFSGRCSREEAASVSRYFRKHPETWKKFMMDSWEEHAADHSVLPGNYKELMLEEISRKTFGDPSAGDRRASVRMAWRWAAAAASILVIFMSLWMFTSKSGKNDAVSRAVASETAVSKTAQTTEAWQTNANHTDQKLKMKLEDGSVVTLFPHSSIRYERHFPDNKRDLYLEGQAFFQAARDRYRPLTVYAGDMATTVLGTSFNVNQNETGVVVKLYSGKVMIRPAGNILKEWKKDIFLLPGEEMKYESGQTEAVVVSFRDDLPVQKVEPVKGGAEDEDMAFNNAALPEVMSKLSKHYRIHIDFHKAELANMYFSGAVLKTDSLSVILKVIANMNDLAITQTPDGFKVRPSKK
ncbi:MAG: FecR domain-containing protein [Puia sp.]|nr:FecR domain-containing protein [Puia sp.]